jgi:hypothetical protein
MRWWAASRPWDYPLNSPPRASPVCREGYVSLLAMSFAFGLAVFGTALAVGMRAYLAAAVLEEQTIRNRMALESAAAAVLGELASGQSTQTTGPRTIGNRSIFLTLSRPGTKLDLAGDEPAALLEALIRQGLGRPEHGVAWRDARSLAEMSARLRLSTAEEDCLRRRFTYGRAPALIDEGAPLTPQAGAGEQLDIRASLIGAQGDEVLWMRARFTGGRTGWKVHDYRRLRGAATCETATP